MNLLLENSALSPLRTEERGRNAAARKEKKKLKLPEIRLDPGEAPMAGLGRAWATWLMFAARVHEGGLVDDEREVHLLRLTMKRLRSYLQLVRPILPESAYREEDCCLRDAARRLAGRRDQAVALRTLERLERKSSKKRARRALEAARRAIESSGVAEGAVTFGRAEGSESGSDAREAALEVLRDGLRRFSQLEPQATGWAVVEGGLYHTYGRARKRFNQWLRSGDAELAHNCRKHAKYLLYQLEFLRPMNPKRIKRMRDELSKMETRLGELNDLWTLERRMEEEAERGALPWGANEVAGGVVRSAAKEIRGSFRKGGKRFFRKRPRKFVGGMGKDWVGWRHG